MSRAFDLSQFTKQANTVNLSVTGNTTLAGVSANTVTASDVVSSSFNGGPLGGFRNLLINSLGTINQRVYTSGAATSGANQYTVDRWRVVTSGQNLSWTESANVRTFTAPAGGVEQVIEGSSIQSGTYVISFTGTATCTVDSVTKASGDTFTLTGGTNCTVRFSGGTFSKPQLEIGTTATPFESRPIGVELALCQRYFRAFASQYMVKGSNTTQVWRHETINMRAVPSVLISVNVGTPSGSTAVLTITNVHVEILSFAAADENIAISITADAEL